LTSLPSWEPLVTSSMAGVASAEARPQAEWSCRRAAPWLHSLSPVAYAIRWVMWIPVRVGFSVRLATEHQNRLNKTTIQRLIDW
jgi:hypothetical protein